MLDLFLVAPKDGISTLRYAPRSRRRGPAAF